jgi:prepilin peptidase CpaA
MALGFAIALAVLAAAAAWSDLRRRRVSNRLCAAVLAIGVAHAWAHPALLLGIPVGLALLLAPFAMRWIGGGDVKLLAALGAWLGATGTLEAALIGLALGGVIAAIMIVASKRTRAVATSLRAALTTMTAPIASRAQLVPLALPLAAAALFVYFHGVA